MHIRDLTPSRELTDAQARRLGGGTSMPVEPDGSLGGPAYPSAEDWYPISPLPQPFDPFSYVGGFPRFDSVEQSL